MLIAKGIIALAFAYAAYLISDKVIDPLKQGKLIQPITVAITATTLSYHLISSGEYNLVISSFVGFFVYVCHSSYKRKPKTKKTKSSNPLNP